MQAKPDEQANLTLPNLADVTRQMQAVQLNAQMALRPFVKGQVPEQIVQTVQALARKFLKDRPGSTPAEFLQELRRGRAPSAALPNDTDPMLQRKLADIISEDPSLLDLI